MTEDQKRAQKQYAMSADDIQSLGEAMDESGIQVIFALTKGTGFGLQAVPAVSVTEVIT